MMGKKKANKANSYQLRNHTIITVDGDTKARLQYFCEAQIVPPKMASVARIALDEFLKKHGY
jgi:hypothetical protein